MSSLRVTVVSLAFVGTKGFDTEPLDTFCRDHDVTSWRDHFFISGGSPHLAVILEYRPREAGRRSEHRDGRMVGEEPAVRERNHRRDLKPSERGLYDRLREWRALRASRDGVPVYVIFNNRQLAEIARSRPGTKSALREIDGVGEARVGKYAEDVFTLLHSTGEGGDNGDGCSEPGEPPGLQSETSPREHSES